MNRYSPVQNKLGRRYIGFLTAAGFLSEGAIDAHSIIIVTIIMFIAIADDCHY